jgi:uncharacterized protein
MHHATIIKKALLHVRPRFCLEYRDGIHGVGHWSRVWHHGRRLASEMQVNPAILAWFAYLHDSQRWNDDHDPLHGSRAADYATRLRRQGVLTELSALEFEHLCEAMRLHSDGHVEGEPALLACWDADRLDLARVGIKPRPHRMCTEHAREAGIIERASRMARGIKRG